MTTVLRQIGKRNQLTIPARLLRVLGIHPGEYVELTEERGKITILPKSIEDKKPSTEEWKKLERLVNQQVKKKKYTESKNVNSAKKHLKRLQR